MDLLEAIDARKSIRAFKPDPVPKEFLMEILGIATRAPSSVNSQPWEFFIVNIVSESHPFPNWVWGLRKELPQR